MTQAASGDTINVGSGTFTANVENPYAGFVTIQGDDAAPGTTVEPLNTSEAEFSADRGGFTLDDLTINGLSGGGIAVSEGGTMNVLDSTVTNSGTALCGCGPADTAFNITNSTISGNAVALSNTPSASINVTASTIADNAAGLEGFGDGVTLSATIVSGNNGKDCAFSGGVATDGGYNLDEDGTCGFTTANHSLSDTNPKLGSLEDNGGPTETIALEPGSPAIDYVNDASLCPATDQRGVTRPVPCSIGAYQPGPATVSGVTFYGSSSDPFIEVTGSGFGSEPTPQPAACQASGDDFGAVGIVLADDTQGWGAGSSGNCIGLFVSLYTNTEITFSFGNSYYDDELPGNPLSPGDSYTMTVNGYTVSGAVSYTTPPGISTTYNCTGPVDFSAAAQVFDTSTPSSPMDEGATYSTSYGLVFDIPASFVSDAYGANVTDMVVDGTSLAVTTSGSGSMTSTTNSSQSTNTPLDLDLGTTANAAADTLIGGTFGTVTWTAATAGMVDFLPGTFDFDISVISSSVSPGPYAFTCSPSPASTIDSTTIEPPSASPSYQASATTVATQVTAGSNVSWDLTVSNTSTQEVTGLSADISVGDGGPALTFDLATMADHGAVCTSAGPGEISCPIGDLAAEGATGSSVSLYPLAETSGLADGTTISGTAELTAANVSGTQGVGLGDVDVAVIANAVEAVASPGVAVTNTALPASSLSPTVPVKVVVKLHKSKTKHLHGSSVVAAQQSSSSCTPTTCTASVPSYVTVTPEATTEQPLCGSGCLGAVTVELTATPTSSTTDPKAPIDAEVSIYFASAPSASDTMYAQLQDGNVMALGNCPKTLTAATEPCLHAKQKKIRSGSGYALEDNIYFLATDPAFGIR